MKLSDVHLEAVKPAEKLANLYDTLLTTNRKRIRTELSRKFYKAKLNTWPQHLGLWRSEGASIVIFGTDENELSHHDFTSDALLVLLKTALVMQMSAVDKILHDAIFKRFTKLTKDRKLDDLARITLSESYQVAVEAQKRKGKGGKVRSRPSARLKSEVVDDLYRRTFLSLSELKKIAKICGKENIFSAFRTHLKTSTSQQSLEKSWERIYGKRNHIAHECDIVRKTKARKVHLNTYTALEIKRDILFVHQLGSFLARELE